MCIAIIQKSLLDPPVVVTRHEINSYRERSQTRHYNGGTRN